MTDAPPIGEPPGGGPPTEPPPDDEAESHPEPVAVSHGVTQDNVSTPGVQKTTQLDTGGSTVTESTHGEPLEEADPEEQTDGD